MAEEDSGDESTSFIRQRRDLFAVTSVLLIVRLSHAHFEEVSMQGIGLKMDRPEVLMWGLWLLWGYWLLRYIQAYNEHARGKVTSAFKSQHRTEFLDHIVRVARRSMRHTIRTEKYRNAVIQSVSFPTEGHDEKGEYIMWTSEIRHNRDKAPRRVILETLPQQDKYYPGRLTRLLVVLRTVFRVTFARMPVTQYWLPLIYAATAPIVWVATRQHC